LNSTTARDFTVIVPTHDRRPYLERALDSLALQTYPAARFEVVVVASNCHDDSMAAVGRRVAAAPYALRVEEETRPGPAAARNHGIRVARGRWLVFLDDDMAAAPDLLAVYHRVLARHEGARPAMVSGRYELVFEGGRPDWLDELIVDLYGDMHRPVATRRLHYPAMVPSGNFAAHRELFDVVGPFDESFVHAESEDTALTFQAYYHGLAVYYAHDAVAQHSLSAHRLTPQEVCRRARDFGATRARVFARIPSTPVRAAWRLLDGLLFGAGFARAVLREQGAHLARRPAVAFAYRCKRNFDGAYFAAIARELLGRGNHSDHQ
jgi:glycosyltransferase involved in cell wall biosynthesis